jgi:hypothetical protein
MFSNTNNKVLININNEIVINKKYELNYSKFINFINNYNYVNINSSIFNIIKDSMVDKTISNDYFYEIMYKKNLYKSGTLGKLRFENIIKTYKLINKYKLLYIIIYYFRENNTYGVIHYNDNSKKNIILLDSYVELILFLYKLELDMNLNPKYSRIINKFPTEFIEINYYILSKYFRFEKYNQ